MSSNVIVPDRNVTSSYVITVDSVAETKYRTVKYASSPLLLEELVNYFSKATETLRQKRRQLFQT